MPILAHEARGRPCTTAMRPPGRLAQVVPGDAGYAQSTEQLWNRRLAKP
jgi:hypothetical protein